MLNQALINGVKMKLEWLVINWEWYGKKDQVLTVLVYKSIPFIYSDIELKVTGPAYQTYLVLFKSFSCSGTEEKLINCSTILIDRSEISTYNCIYQPGIYYYATIDCIPGIYYIIPIHS